MTSRASERLKVRDLELVFASHAWLERVECPSGPVAAGAAGAVVTAGAGWVVVVAGAGAWIS
jgi:hypothetical protein